MPQLKVNRINILKADDKKLQKLSNDFLLSLSLEEMQIIKKYFKKLGRNPTDVELETIAQTWSEHCKHKVFTGLIEYTSETGEELIDNLLKQTVMKVTKELNKKWCLSVFEDNAGIISFNDDYALAFKVETHNHPSALEPYGGAGTGIGGVIRDILGVGLGAKPILNTDVFCFGPPDYDFNRLPVGVLHPKRICKGVVAGVRDYGNRMGIPTVNGAVCFDEGYVCNPLVYCGTVGIMQKSNIEKQVNSGDLIVSVGGKTGRDGIHGATFSSLSLDESTEVSAVQIGNPIVEKKVADTLLKAANMKLYRAVTDCGAGGFSSAVGELGKDCGAEVYLEKAPLKYEGLAPWEIWVSEAQERMVLAVPPEKLDRIMKIFEEEDVEATLIGKFTNTNKLHLMFKGQTVAALDMKFLHDGVPKIKRKAQWKAPELEEPDALHLNKKNNYSDDLRKILASFNVCSKEWIIRQYDHEVQAGTVLKSLQGITNDGPGDAAVIKPFFNSLKGVVVSNGINPRYGFIDPYWMAASAIDESLRNIISSGGNLEQTALLDNFCWGDPKKPIQLAGLVRAAKACYDMASVFGTPFISGKDSLNNEYINNSGQQISIPQTLLISAICVIDNIEKTVSMDIKEKDSLIYILGETRNELGGSHYYSLYNFIGKNVPRVEPAKANKLMVSLSSAMALKTVLSCHDCSEGGLAVSCAEMAFSGGIGIEIGLDSIPCSLEADRDDIRMFSESNSRFIVEVSKENQARFEEIMKGNVFAQVGRTMEEKTLRIQGMKNSGRVEEGLEVLKESWKNTLAW